MKAALRRAVPAGLWRRLQLSKRAVLEFIDRRPVLRNGLFWCQDTADLLLGRRDPLVPPRRLVHAIGGNFRGVGRRFRDHFLRLGGLRPHERVLDVGCGCGRMAVALVEYLQPPGSYDGFDIMRDCVAWCQRAVTPRCPHFRFRHVDVYNRHYNLGGPVRQEEFRFPYDDASFDFVFLTSVFTHLLPTAAARYLGEVARVLRPGGRCLATFFLLNAESEAAVAAGRAALPFQILDGYATTDPQTPEVAVALPEAFVRAELARHGLAVTRLEPGTWSGRAAGFEAHDLLVARKDGLTPSPLAPASGARGRG